MQEQLQEIEGTLARSSQRKQTIISELHKREREHEIIERFGVNELPSEPEDTNNVDLIKFVINNYKQKIGSSIADLRNPAVLNIIKDGELIIRQKNNELNRLIQHKHEWEMRLRELSKSNIVKNKILEAPKKVFIGCAVELPEAKHRYKERKNKEELRQSLTENESEEDLYSDSFIDENSDTEEDNFGRIFTENKCKEELEENFEENSNALATEEEQSELISHENKKVLLYKQLVQNVVEQIDKEAEDKLMLIERRKEQELRRSSYYQTFSLEPEKASILHRLMSIKEHLPSEEDIKQKMLQERKERLIEKCNTLRSNN